MLQIIVTNYRKHEYNCQITPVEARPDGLFCSHGLMGTGTVQGGGGGGGRPHSRGVLFGVVVFRAVIIRVFGTVVGVNVAVVRVVRVVVFLIFLRGLGPAETEERRKKKCQVEK